MGDIKIPGKAKYEWREVIYIEVPPGKDFENEMFRDIITQHKPLIPKTGGMISENFVIIIPDGTLYFALSYNEDIEGWRQQILYGAKQFNLKIGFIMDEKEFITSDGETFTLEECTFERYNFYDKDRNLIKTRIPVNKEDII